MVQCGMVAAAVAATTFRFAIRLRTYLFVLLRRPRGMAKQPNTNEREQY